MEKMRQESKRRGSMNTIEDEAKEILGHLSYGSSASVRSGEESLETRYTSARIRDRRRALYEDASIDDASIVSFLMDGEAGGMKLLCM